MAVNRPDIIRCAVNGVFGGQNWVNVLHFWKRDGSAATPTDLNTLAGLLDNVKTAPEAVAGLYEQTSTANVITGFVLTSEASGGNVPYTKAVTLNETGNSTGTLEQAMLAVVARWSTGIASRHTRGRTFIPGLTAGAVGTDPDYVSTAYSTSFVADWTAFVNYWLGNTTFAFVVFSKFSEGAVSGSGEAEILSASINPVLAVQRRRRPRATA